MSGKLVGQIKEIVNDKNVTEKVMRVIDTAGQEFPCLSCPSKDECKTFNWFTKWFGDSITNQQESILS